MLISTTGAVIVTVNGDVTTPTAGSAPISMVSSTGTHTVLVNSDIAGDFGIFSSTDGARDITIAAGGSVDGDTQAAIHLEGSGTADITNAGTVGSASTDFAVNASAAGDTVLTNQSGGVVNGFLTLSAGADTFSNAGTWNTQGTTDFGGGIDDFANDAGGVFSLAGDTTLANLETFSNDGTIDLATFTLTGPAIAFVNNGTIDTDGNAAVAGFTTFDNDGTLDLGPGTFTVIAGVPFTNTGTILADEGASTITGQTSFANSGTLDLSGWRDGRRADDRQRLRRLRALRTLEIDFDGLTADRLVIDGAASGSTTVDVFPAGDIAINPDNVLVIDTNGTRPRVRPRHDHVGLIDLSLAQVGDRVLPQLGAERRGDRAGGDRRDGPEPLVPVGPTSTATMPRFAGPISGSSGRATSASGSGVPQP